MQCNTVNREKDPQCFQHSVAYLGGAWCDAPLWPDHENFLQATLYKKCVFCRFPANFWKNGRICGFHWTFKSKKCFSFRGASPPDPPTRGSAPGSRWGLRPQTPAIGSRSARSPCPPCQILNTPLVMRFLYLTIYCTNRCIQSVWASL